MSKELTAPTVREVANRLAADMNAPRHHMLRILLCIIGYALVPFITKVNFLVALLVIIVIIAIGVALSPQLDNSPAYRQRYNPESGAALNQLSSKRTFITFLAILAPMLFINVVIDLIDFPLIIVVYAVLGALAGALFDWTFYPRVNPDSLPTGINPASHEPVDRVATAAHLLAAHHRDSAAPLGLIARYAALEPQQLRELISTTPALRGRKKTEAMLASRRQQDLVWFTPTR